MRFHRRPRPADDVVEDGVVEDGIVEVDSRGIFGPSPSAFLADYLHGLRRPQGIRPIVLRGIRQIVTRQQIFWLT